MKNLLTIATLTLAAFSVARAQDAPAAPPNMALIAPDNSLNFSFYQDGRPTLYLGAGGWGPNWGWRDLSAHQRGDAQGLSASTVFEGNKDAGEIINFGLTARQNGPNSVVYQYTLQADKDVPLTELMASVSTAWGAQDGQAIVTRADGQTQSLPLALNQVAEIPATSRVQFQPKNGGETILTIEPPAPLHVDNGIRVLMARDQFAAGTKTYKLTLTFPQPITLMAREADLAGFTKTLAGADWFAWAPKNEVGPSVIGFENWLDKPAGKHGGVRISGDHFEFADKTPVKFWGTNLSYAASAPEKADADFMAARLAKWGVNAVRMHKFTGPNGWEGIGDPEDVTKMDAAGLDRLDYFSSQLAANGVYFGWSHTYHFKMRAANRARLLAPDEIMNNLGGDTYGLINVAPDVQDLLIESVVNLLRHRNPYSGQTYAQDPALAYIELQNEDDVFFYNTEGALGKAPTYKAQLLKRWGAWLAAKYKTQSALATAWGDALKGGETLDTSIEIQLNPWFFGADNLPNKSAFERQRLADNAAFLHGEQENFYARFTRAIRDAGYAGPLVGSPWQAPSMLPHFYNLSSDARVGYVDRHNYFGGGLNDSMLKNPGSGYFSSGLQQVAGRPFGLSEWIHVYPSLYSAEGPAILAAYGMGLQGWDASYEFQSGGGGAAFSDRAGNFPWGIWNADVPTQIGQYPLLARMIARGDVPQGDVISVRRVSADNLAQGAFDFNERATQDGDVKNFDGSVPPSALAAGRVLVEFDERARASTLPDMSLYRAGTAIRANNGALNWETAGRGYFTVNTSATKAVVGFAGDKELKLGSVSVKLASTYASLFITAAEPKADLNTAKSALISAVARSSNSGFSYFTLDNRVIENGQGPILVEPVKATISFGKRAVAAVNVLDQNGQRSGRTLAVVNGQFTLDEAIDKTIYYEVVFR